MKKAKLQLATLDPKQDPDAFDEIVGLVNRALGDEASIHELTVRSVDKFMSRFHHQVVEPLVCEYATAEAARIRASRARRARVALASPR